MNNQVTLRDIAREAGVSVATVSYVLNGREEQKISAETRKKVLQIANLLGYTGNSYARSLVTGKSYCIALSCGTGGFLARAHCADFAHRFSEKLAEHGYSLVITPRSATRINADAVVCLNLPESDFHTVAELTYSPVISVDALVSDPLFFSITTNYPALLEAASEKLGKKPVYIGFHYNSPALEGRISSVFGDARFYSDVGELISAAPQLGELPIVCESAAVYEILLPYCKSIYLCDNCLQKSSVVYEYILHGINRDYIELHDITV